MINIVLSDKVVIINGDKDDLNKILKYETYDDDSHCFSKAGYNPMFLKHVPVLKYVRESLVGYSGLAKEIFQFCRDSKIKINDFKDKREHFDFQNKEWNHDNLRLFFPKEFDYVEHQINSLQSMIKTNTGIIKAPTSAGKSKILSAYIRLSKIPTLILENKVTLAMQIKEDLKKDGIDCGICTGKGVEKGYCMVSTIQSVKKLQDYTRYKCLLIDEVQNAKSESYQEFLKMFPVPLRFGFSASPSRTGKYLDFAKIRQFMGSEIINIKSEELIENKVMAKPTIYVVNNEVEQFFDYPTSYDNCIVHNDKRNKIAKNIVDKYKDEVLILVNIIEHGEELEKLIPGSVFISGDTPTEDRIKILKDFDDGKIKVLIGSTILQEGISITHMKAMILLCGGKSNVAIIQKIGRSLRFKKGEKETVDFYDFADSGNSYLYKHAKTRIKLYKDNGYNDIHLLDEELNGK